MLPSVVIERNPFRFGLDTGRDAAEITQQLEEMQLQLSAFHTQFATKSVVLFILCIFFNYFLYPSTLLFSLSYVALKLVNGILALNNTLLYTHCTHLYDCGVFIHCIIYYRQSTLSTHSLVKSNINLLV